MFHLQPLTNVDVKKAQALAAQLFPWEVEHQEALAAAAGLACREQFLRERGLSHVRALCLREGENVVGLASLYDYREAPEEVWLAWFGLSPEVRGRGLGTRMLDCVIEQGKRDNKDVLRLWTTIEDEYATALQLYARRGFRPELQPALPGEDWQTVVLSLALRGGTPPPWLSRAYGTLCGRVTRVAA